MKLDNLLKMNVGDALLLLFAGLACKGNAAAAEAVETEVVETPKRGPKAGAKAAKAAPAPEPESDDDDENLLDDNAADDEDDLLAENKPAPAKKEEKSGTVSFPPEIVELQELAVKASKNSGKDKVIAVLGKVGVKKVQEVPADKIKAVKKAFTTLAGE